MGCSPSLQCWLCRGFFLLLSLLPLLAGAGCFLAVLSSRRQQEGGLEKELGRFFLLLGVLILLSRRHLGMAVSPDVKGNGNGNGNGRGVLPSTLSQLHLSWHLKHLPLQTLLEAHADVCVLGNKRVNLAILKVPLLVFIRFNTCLHPAPQLTAILGPRHLHDIFFFLKSKILKCFQK